MGFFGKIKEMAIGVKDAIQPKAILDYVWIDEWLSMLKKAKDECDLQGRKFDSPQEDAANAGEAESKPEMKKDVRYYGEAYLVNFSRHRPKVNELVLVPRKSDGIWLAASIEEADPESGRIRCGSEWHDNFVFYRYNEELVGTARKPKNPENLRYGDRVLVCDDLNDEPKTAVFVGFEKNIEIGMNWITLASERNCLESLSNGQLPSFGSWKYMWLPEEGD